MMSARQTILVVEDNKYQLLLYEQELSFEGYIPEFQPEIIH